jgi:hypothetical protein
LNKFDTKVVQIYLEPSLIKFKMISRSNEEPPKPENKEVPAEEAEDEVEPEEGADEEDEELDEQAEAGWSNVLFYILFSSKFSIFNLCKQFLALNTNVFNIYFRDQEA